MYTSFPRASATVHFLQPSLPHRLRYTARPTSSTRVFPRVVLPLLAQVVAPALCQLRKRQRCYQQFRNASRASTYCTMEALGFCDLMRETLLPPNRSISYITGGNFVDPTSAEIPQKSVYQHPRCFQIRPRHTRVLLIQLCKHDSLTRFT